MASPLKPGINPNTLMPMTGGGATSTPLPIAPVSPLAIGTFPQNTPASQTPVTPTPLPQTPAAPQAPQLGDRERAYLAAGGTLRNGKIPEVRIDEAGNYVDIATGKVISPQMAATSNPAAQPTTPTTTASPVQVNVNTGTTAPTKPQTAASSSAPGANALTMPGNGSVVDLLNSAGVDSSFANRSNLAKQFGIQGYTGTAAQNQQLAKKYLDAFNKSKDTQVPDTAAAATSAISALTQDNDPAKSNPEAAFFDAYAGMNPIVKSLYDALNQQLSSIGTQKTFTEQYQNLIKEQGIPGLQTELLNMQRIMDGTEDDIRDEITNVGGFATESQVQALTGARNKTLLKQAQFLQGQLAFKNDYVKQVMDLTQADRAQVEKDLDRKLNITTKMADLTMKISDAAKENYQKIVDIGEKRGVNGYAYLAESLGGDPNTLKNAENALGLPTGALSSAGFIAPVKNEEWSQPYKLGNSYVQKNTKTGEIRTAASIPSSGGGISGPTSYQEWVLAGKPGTYADYLKDSNVKAPTVAQQTVSTYAVRVEQANPTISRFEGYVSGLSPAKFEIQRKLPSYFQSAEYQEFDQAARNFINATLRRESGAVISPSEFDNAYRQYLPRAGDTQGTLQQKKINRELIYTSFKKAAGNAFQSVDELLGTAPIGGAPKKGDTRLYEGHPYTFNGKEWELKK